MLKPSIKIPHFSQGMRLYRKEILKAVPKALAAAVPVLQNTFKDVWDEGQGSWPPLDPKYKARKIKQGYSGDILKRTQATYKALTSLTTNTYKRIEQAKVLKYGLKTGFYRLYFVYTQARRSLGDVLFGASYSRHLKLIRDAMWKKYVELESKIARKALRENLKKRS